MELDKNQILTKIEELKQVLPEDFRTIIDALVAVVKAEFTTSDPTADPPIKTELKTNKTSKTSKTTIEKLLEKAVLDDVIYCGFCGYEPLEPDYDVCPDCGEKNPLKTHGLI